MGQWDGIGEIPDHADRRIGIDDLQKPALAQVVPIVQVRGKRWQAGCRQPDRVMVDLIDDVVGGLGEGFSGSSETTRRQNPLAKRTSSVSADAVSGSAPA